MSVQSIERLIEWLRDAPHYPRCNSEFGEQLCSCGKREAVEIAEMLYGENREEEMI